MAAQEYGDLLCVRDSRWQDRLTNAIGLKMQPSGLLFQALNEQTKPLRRYFTVRMLLRMADAFPEVGPKPFSFQDADLPRVDCNDVSGLPGLREQHCSPDFITMQQPCIGLLSVYVRSYACEVPMMCI